MVTKSYLDDKLADLRGDLVTLIGKEDKKLDALIDTFVSKKMLTNSERKHIASVGPFSRLSR